MELEINDLEKALKKYRFKVHRVLFPNFLDVLLRIPSLADRWLSLRTKFQANPDQAIEDLLDLVAVSEDIDLWKEFFVSLDYSNCRTTRRLFLSDESKYQPSHQQQQFSQLSIDSIVAYRTERIVGRKESP